MLAGFVVLGSGLGERFGRKAIVQTGTLVFAAGAAVSAFALNLGTLITGPACTFEEFRATVIVPAEAEPSLESVQRRICWRIEIRGKVAGSADFMRPFDVEVV